MEVIEINPMQVYTLESAAHILHVSKPTLYRWCREGKVPSKKIGRAYRFLGSMLLTALQAEHAAA